MALIPPITQDKEKTEFDPLSIECPSTDNIAIAQYAVVAEAPSHIELIEQEPLVGPAGSQFNRICASAGIPRYKLYLTNCCKAKLPNNNTNKLWTAKGYRCPEWGELQRRLIDELSQFKGQLIILLGNTAMRMLIDEPRFAKISKYRGSIYRAEEFPHLAEKLAGKYIAFTFHPASCLARNKPINFYIIMADLIKFKSFDEDPSLLDAQIAIHVEPTFHEVLRFYKRINQYTEVGFDIESTPTYITCFAFAIQNTDGSLEAMSIPLMNNLGHYWSEEEEIEIWVGMSEIMMSPKIGIVCQNGMFDIMFTLRTMNIITNNFSFDTMLAQHIVYTDLPKGLDYLTSVYTFFPAYKDEGKNFHTKVNKDWPKYWRYNAKDAAYILPIKNKLQEELISINANDAMDYTMALHKPLMEMEWNGVLTNQKGIKEKSKSYTRMILAMQHGLKKLVGKDLNVNSSPQMVSYFYGHLQIKPYIKRKTKKATCDAMALTRIAKRGLKGSNEARLIRKIRKYSKLLSTYFTVNVDKDDRLRCSHKISGTNSGRIATEKTFFGTGTNLQNQPSAFKEFIIADKDYILCEVDLAKAEVHVVAYLTQDANMIQAFETGIDFHTFTASKIYDILMEEVTKKQRQMGKKVVHASDYGMGPHTFSNDLAVGGTFKSVKECKQLLDAYAARFPNLERWHKQIESEVCQNRILYNLFGRPKRFMGMLEGNLYRSAYSFKPQSTVAELLNRGTIKMANDPRLGRNGYNIDLLTTVHDSVLFQFHKDQIKNLLNILLIIKEHMTHTFIYKGRSFTIGLDAKIGKTWAGNTAEISTFDQQHIDDALHKIGVYHDSTTE